MQRDFNDFLREGLERSNRAAATVREMHQERPLHGAEIGAAFQHELSRLEKESAEFAALKIDGRAN